MSTQNSRKHQHPPDSMSKPHNRGYRVVHKRTTNTASHSPQYRNALSSCHRVFENVAYSIRTTNIAKGELNKVKHNNPSYKNTTCFTEPRAPANTGPIRLNSPTEGHKVSALGTPLLFFLSHQWTLGTPVNASSLVCTPTSPLSGRTGRELAV